MAARSIGQREERSARNNAVRGLDGENRHYQPVVDGYLTDMPGSPTIRSATAIRAFFLAFAALAALLLVLVLTSDNRERVGLSVIAGVVVVTCLLCALLARRMVRWEGAGGPEQHRE